MRRRENLPLPNMEPRLKLLFSGSLLAAVLVYAATWTIVIDQVYPLGFLEDRFETFGAQLGVFASMNEGGFYQLLAFHSVAALALLGLTSFLFLKTSLRQRFKGLILVSASALTLIDLAAWLYAPRCSSANPFVGVVGLLAGGILVLMAVLPLLQLWIYRRWPDAPEKPVEVVIVGGGFAGLYTALGLHKILGYHKKLSITVVDRKNYFLFPPLLPSAAAGTIESRQVSYPYRRIFETTNLQFRKVDVVQIEPQKKLIHGLVEVNRDPDSGKVEEREGQFSYDYLVLAPGSATQTFKTKGADEHAFFMRELNDSVLLRNQVIDCFERAAVVDDHEIKSELLRFVVVGGGPTGVETATEIFDLIEKVLLKRYPEVDESIPEVMIVQSGSQVLPGWDPSIVETVTAQLGKLGIKLLLGGRVSEVGSNFIKTADGASYRSRTIIWCAGVKPSVLVGRSGLPVHQSGRIEVESDLRVKDFPNVFVLGDAAHLVDKKSGKPLPPLGQVAFQQGSHTARNVARLLLGQQTKPFRYFDFGGLVSAGEHFAAAKLLGIRLTGFIGWFVWRTLYLAKIVGFSNKIRIVTDWTLDLLIERSISQVLDSVRDPSQLVKQGRVDSAPHVHLAQSPAA